MALSCESVARQILPFYRSAVARELITKYKLTQVQAAKKLGTTQAAISQYINSKRGYRDIPQYEQIAPLVQEAAAKVAERISTTEIGPADFNASFCDLCKKLRQTRLCL
jgi:predicted transcriptional regulator